ncbi:hypothetical protein DPMN_100247 [Dreissena polymorpha]|uniref:Uncharacterized protein n=1 Tax=Dreissena polymorpha TaxID=45954 RepID=A0A9D4LIU7_DREPO|nr:hypothetical protein DPMN_100247 [Dreissena polymorpha]
MYESLACAPPVRETSSTIADSLGISCMCSYGLGPVADCMDVSCRCLSGLRDCLATSQTAWGSAAGTPPVHETVWYRQILSESFLQVPRRFWHRHRPFLCILLVPRRSSHRRRLSGILEGAHTVLKTFGNVWESPAATQTVLV